ncbi:MAG: N-acetylmuramidase domain-containing protein [Chloroflexi bacterium]|nr:N-acetylmuramidase domain-containing protein [Chloroflexota bacterium]
MSEVGICLMETTIHPRSDFTGGALSEVGEGERVTVLRARGAWCRVATAAGAEGFARVDRSGHAGFLVADAALQSAPVEAAPLHRLDPRGGAQAQAVARTWNLYGGLLEELARRIQVDPAAAASVLVVESSGQAYGPDGRVIIRFENHVFRRYLGEAQRAAFNRHFQVGGEQPWLGHLYRRSASEAWGAFHGSQALEWDALDVARRIDERAALSSISMGLPQVMGFNHQAVGYAHPGHMLAFMAADVRYQLLALFDFIRGGQANSRAVNALRSGDYDTFASIYNGPGQAQYYGELIASHVAAFRSLRPATSTLTKQPPVARATSGGGATYTVRPGDTLGAIAGRFGVATDAIAALNAIQNANLIRVGQSLRLPKATAAPPSVSVPSTPPEDVTAEGEVRAQRTHVVQAGDTLGAIAQRVGSTVPVIAEANGIKDVNRIFPGQVLAIP